MKVFLSIVLLGVIFPQLISGWSFEYLSKKILQPSKQIATNPDIISPVNTISYEKYVCRGKPDNSKLIVPGNCASYYICSNNEATVKTCKKPTPYYDAVSKNCVTKSTCEEGNIRVSGGPIGCDGLCCGKPVGLYADTLNKKQFYFCNNNVGILHSCCGDKQFNPITKACDVASNCS